MKPAGTAEHNTANPDFVEKVAALNVPITMQQIPILKE